MSFDSFHRRSQKRHRTIDTRTDDGRPTDCHIGNAQAFLRRHQRECSRYDRMSLSEQRNLQNDLLVRIADKRNLRRAVEHLTDQGEKAPGPNGQRLARLDQENPRYVWNEIHRLSAELLSATYRPGKTRRIMISKGPGRGARPIDIANWQDLVVQRAIVQIIQPLLDPRFDDLSLGYRPGRDRTEAVARAMALAEADSRYVWITADLKDAFTHVPHQYLVDCLQQHLGNETVVELIRTIVVNNNSNQGTDSNTHAQHQRKQRGVPQGGPLSPLMLNVLLDKALDQRWKVLHHEVPLIRVADDILILCRSDEEAQQCWQDLHRLVQPIGMKLKGSMSEDIRNLAAGETAEWLGYAMGWQQGQLCVNLPRTFGDKLRLHLQRALTESDGILGCAACLRGCMEQLGAVYNQIDHYALFRLIADVTRSLGIDEIPTQDELSRLWELSASRFLAQRTLWKQLTSFSRPLLTASDQGFAAGHQTQPHQTADNSPRALPVGESLQRSEPTTLIATSAWLPCGIGCWAYAIWRIGHERPQIAYKAMQNITANRLALQAVVCGLQQLTADDSVRIFADSAYVHDSLESLLADWKRRGGRSHSGTMVANWDLWCAADQALANRRWSISSSPGDTLALPMQSANREPQTPRSVNQTV